MTEKFISEPLKPIIATLDTSRMAIGEPGLPHEFTWRDQTVRIVEVRRSWRDTGPCTHKSGEVYVRKHWYEVVTGTGDTMKIYFQRQRRGGPKSARWHLYSIAGPTKPY
jgi:phosphoribosylglycinamide formyltransferase-1